MTHDLRPAVTGAGLTDHDLAVLVERDYGAYAAAFEAAPGITILRTGNHLVRRSDLAHRYLNLVLGTWADDESADVLIREVSGDLGGPGREFTWPVWPSNTPADLRSRLERAGFRYEDDGPLMVLDLDEADLPPEPPAGLTIELATGVDTLREGNLLTMSMVGTDPDVQAIFMSAYEALAFGADRSMVYFAGRVDGRIVASSALYTGTGLAGVVGVGTLPDMRGRGYGRALTIAALAEGRRRGLRIGALMSSDLGLPVYRRLGFREVGTVGFFASPVAAQ